MSRKLHDVCYSVERHFITLIRFRVYDENLIEMSSTFSDLFCSILTVRKYFKYRRRYYILSIYERLKRVNELCKSVTSAIF